MINPKFKMFALQTVLMSILFIGSAHFVNAATVDLREYYPNPQLYENYYLEGTNRRDINNPVRNVLWFSKENEEGTRFKQYNYGPEDAQKNCHWDLLAWENGFFNYSQTYNGCDGNSKNVTFSTPIQFLPRYWDDANTWTHSGSSTQTTTKLDGTPGCVGTNNWTSTILGRETVAPGIQAIHWRTEQTINWTSGDDSPICIANSTTNWQEDVYLTDNIAVANYKGLTSAPGLYRTVGGNLDTFNNTGFYDWDITMNQWTLLPWGTAQEIPGVPNAGTMSKSKQVIPIIIAIATIALPLLIVSRSRVSNRK